MKTSIRVLLVSILVCAAVPVMAQDQSTKRRVSVALNGKDPVSGYLIRSDADTLVVEGVDGKLQVIPLDEVSMIFVAPRGESGRAAATSSGDEDTAAVNNTVRALQSQVDRLDAKLKEQDAQGQRLASYIDNFQKTEDRAAELRAEQSGL